MDDGENGDHVFLESLYPKSTKQEHEKSLFF